VIAVRPTEDAMRLTWWQVTQSEDAAVRS